MSNIRFQFLGFATLFSLALLIQGCGSDPTEPPRELGVVTGTVTLNGKPVSGIEVMFSPDEGGGDSTAATDENGQYELQYPGGRSGALVGIHTVSFRDEGEEMLDGEPLPGGDEEGNRIPEKYTFGKSVLKKEVKEGVQTIPLEINSK